MTEPSGLSQGRFDVVIVGGGPAGLSAALNLARANSEILLVDASRPRNSATLRSHGFLTRDGMSPTELRKLARAELANYDNVSYVDREAVSRVTRNALGGGFTIEFGGRGQETARTVRAETVLLATGLRESLPAIPSIRAFYGMSLFSCVACDAWDLRGEPLALIGETADLHARALHLSGWSSDITVFTNGEGLVTAAEEDDLARRGITVERTSIDDLHGERGAVTSVHLTDGRSLPISGGFIRPKWDATTDFLGAIQLDRDDSGYVAIDHHGRTSENGVYAAGDIASPGPQQMIIAAGNGAMVAARIVHDLLGITTARIRGDAHALALSTI